MILAFPKLSDPCQPHEFPLAIMTVYQHALPVFSESDGCDLDESSPVAVQQFLASPAVLVRLLPVGNLMSNLQTAC